MQTIYLFLEGVVVDQDYTFSNGFILSNAKDKIKESDLHCSEEIRFLDQAAILHVCVEKDEYNREKVELGFFMADLISMQLDNQHGISVLAVSNFHLSNFVQSIFIRPGKSVKLEGLNLVDGYLNKYFERTPKDQRSIKTALCFLNKSKICLDRYQGNVEHAIFLRVAIENCFSLPKHKLTKHLKSRAGRLLGKYASDELSRKIGFFYDQTSNAVHKGEVPLIPGKKNREKKVKVNGLTVLEIVRLFIIELIENGAPDWEVFDKDSVICPACGNSFKIE
jgi:hypothetical protein